MRCPSCNHDNRAERRFCVECGVALVLKCPACGAPYEAGEKFCGVCGASLGAAPIPSAEPSRPPALTLGSTDAGERRQVTALFCDLVGSTEMASHLDPEEWHRISKDYQQAAAAAVTRFGGHVDKFLGDGLVCFFGVPQAHEDDAERAVRAGLAIVEAVHALNAKSAAPVVRLQVRVGMHTGSAVVAQGGGESKDVFGDTPNIAARVQGVAEPDTVVISDATQRLVAGLFVVEERGAQPLKGVPQPVHLYRVVQPSGVRSRLAVSAGRHTPFVGRQTELGVLADAWARVVDGMGQTVLVQGEAGIGKSRLCYEMREQLSGEPHTWLECQCSPFTVGTAFRPVTELVEQALNFQVADTPADKLGKLGVGLARAGFAADEAVPLLAEWLDLPPSAGYTPLQTNADLKRHKTLVTLAAWNLKLGELQPTVVLVEDLHWCDPSSLELLGRLVAQSATARVLLVGTARPEFASPWPARSNLQTLTLGRLTKRQTREMIGAVSAARELPETVVEQLVGRADGIPLFAEELTQSVVEAGGSTGETTIPMTLQDSLLARLDRLSSAKEVAQRAAVLGREFSYPLLAAMTGMDDGALQLGLARLAEAEILFVRGAPPVATYTFKHALVQEAAYESLLKRTRQQLHGRVVDVLAQEFPERAAAEPQVVAQHAELAGRVDEAIALYQRAADRARTRSAYEEGVGDASRAIALLGTLPESTERHTREAELQLALGNSLTAARGYTRPEVEAAFERARQLCVAVEYTRGLGHALLGLSVFSHNTGQVERAGALAARALAIAERINDAELNVRAHESLGTIEQYQGRLPSALDHFEAALALYRPGRRHLQPSSQFSINDRDVPQLAYSAFSICLLGWPDRALARAREAVALARRIDHAGSLVFALLWEALLHAVRRDAAAQRERAAELVAVGETYGLPFWLGLGRTFHAAAGVAAGESEAVADLLPGLVQSGGTGNRGGAPGLFVVVADAYLTASRLSEARGAVETGLALAAETGQAFMDAELLRLQGAIALRAVDSPGSRVESEQAAQESFHRALDIARAQEAKSLELRAAMSLARLWRDQGKRTEARDLLAPVYAWFTEGFGTGDLIDARALLEELRLDEGRPEVRGVTTPLSSC